MKHPPADLRFPASGIAREQRGAVEHDADARSFSLHLGDHMLKEQQGTVGCAWCAGEKPSVGILCFGRHELFFAFPGYAEGRIGDHVVELLAREPVFAQGGAEPDVVGVFARDEQVGFADGVGLRIEFLPVYPDFYLRIDILEHPVFADGEHTAGATAGIEHRADLALALQVFPVARKHQRDEQPHDVAGGVMLPAGLVTHFGELPQKLLEDLPHRMVIHHIGMQVHRTELLDQQKQAVVLMQLLHQLIQLEILDDIVNVLRKPVNVIPEIDKHILRILLQPRKIILRHIVKFSLYTTADDRRRILHLRLILLEQRIDLILPRLNHTIQPPQNHKRQNHIPILMRLEQAPQHIIGYVPNKRRKRLEVRHSQVFRCLVLWNCKFIHIGFNIQIS